MSQPRLYDQAADPRNDMGKEAFEADLDKMIGPEPSPTPLAEKVVHYEDQADWNDYALQAEANKSKGEIAVRRTVAPPAQPAASHKPHFA